MYLCNAQTITSPQIIFICRLRHKKKTKTHNKFIRSWIRWMPNAIHNEKMQFAWANWKMPIQLIVMCCTINPMSRFFCRSVSTCIASKNYFSQTHTIVSWVSRSIWVLCADWTHESEPMNSNNILYNLCNCSCTDRRSCHLTHWRNFIFIATRTVAVPIRRNQSGTILQWRQSTSRLWTKLHVHTQNRYPDECNRWNCIGRWR